MERKLEFILLRKQGPERASILPKVTQFINSSFYNSHDAHGLFLTSVFQFLTLSLPYWLRIVPKMIYPH